MKFQDPLLEGFCWDHGFYSALSCPRCSKGSFSSSLEERIKAPEEHEDISLFYLLEEKQFAHED